MAPENRSAQPDRQAANVSCACSKFPSAPVKVKDQATCWSAPKSGDQHRILDCSPPSFNKCAGCQVWSTFIGGDVGDHDELAPAFGLDAVALSYSVWSRQFFLEDGGLQVLADFLLDSAQPIGSMEVVPSINATGSSSRRLGRSRFPAAAHAAPARR